jgi:hypothetical protein
MVSRRTAAHSTHDGGRRQEEEEEEEEEEAGATAACSHQQQNNNRSTNSYHLPTRPTTSGKQNKPNFFVKKNRITYNIFSMSFLLAKMD